MEIVRKPIPRDSIAQIAKQIYGELLKAVVDVEKRIIAINMELHADGEMLLLENGSKQSNLWGINLYPGKNGADFIEFDSMINIRPSQNNRSRGIEDPETQKKVINIVNELIS